MVKTLISKSKKKYDIYQTLKKDIAESILEIINIISKSDIENKKLIENGIFLIREAYNKEEFDNFAEEYYPKHTCLFIISGVILDLAPGMYISQKVRHPIYDIYIYGKDEAYIGYIHSIISTYIIEYFREYKKLNSVITELSFKDFIISQQSYIGKISIKLTLIC